MKSNKPPSEGGPFVQFRGKGKGVPYSEYFELMGNAMTERFGRDRDVTFWKTDEMPTIPPVQVDDLVRMSPESVIERLLERHTAARDKHIERRDDDMVAQTL